MDYSVASSQRRPERFPPRHSFATEQRIPGLGNGVLQDIRGRRESTPKKKGGDFSGQETAELYMAIKNVPGIWRKRRPRYGKRFVWESGGYRTILSKTMQPWFVRNAEAESRKKPDLGAVSIIARLARRCETLNGQEETSWARRKKAIYDLDGTEALFLEAMRESVSFHRDHCTLYRKLLEKERFNPMIIAKRLEKMIENYA